ncbi:MAG: TetR/AcrR family transcriptional regulator [Caldilineaceae bacterium]|nr:TetR/AcrR family transcriptional regulator [Caldilineaceae bacterium]
MDRRTIRSRQLLRDSLVTWMLEKEYEAISVQDITDRADLGRATFYLHYKDKDDLLLSMLEALYDELVDRIETQCTLHNFSVPPIQYVFEHAAENKDLYKVVLSGAGKTALLTRTRDYMVTLLVKSMKELDNAPQIPLEVTAVYLAGAQMHLIGWWLEKEMPYSIHEMVNMYQGLTMYGVMAMLGLTEPLWKEADAFKWGAISQSAATDNGAVL